MSNTMHLRRPQAGDALLTAPRQFWLATIGAAAVTRDWADKEAGTMFRALVKEGAGVESKAIRLVRESVDASLTRATGLAGNTRKAVATAVTSFTDAASAVMRRLPALGASVHVEAVPPRKSATKPAKRAKTATKSHAGSRRRTGKTGAAR